MTDAADYRKESRTRWGAAAKGWAAQADAMGRTTMPVSVWMVDALGLQPGNEVLELAAGTGEVGFLAAEQIAPTGTLISSDFAPEMITSLRRGRRGSGSPTCASARSTPRASTSRPPRWTVCCAAGASC